jgi:hypothetical protein
MRHREETLTFSCGGESEIYLLSSIYRLKGGSCLSAL